LVYKEITKIIEQVAGFLSEEFRTIINGLSKLKQAVDREQLKELQKRFTIALVSQQDEETRERNRNLLLTLENYLLESIKAERTRPLQELLFEAFDFINNFEVQLKNSVEQLLVTRKILKLYLPLEPIEQAKVAIFEQQIGMANVPDKKILALFLYHLERTKRNGWLITLDLGDFHANAPILQGQFQQLTILRPGYFSSIYHS